MNDTPRVTVPVERLELASRLLGQGRLQAANHVVQEMLSASPSPEGGAVWSEYIRLLEGKIKQWTDPDYLGDDRLEVDDALELADAIKAALSALATREEAPAEAGELKADFTRSHPSGLDDATYSQIEDALDRADAPIIGPDRKFLTLAQRVDALRAQPQARTISVFAEAIHDRMFGVSSLQDPALALAEISDGGGLHEAVHELLRSLPPRQPQAREDAQPFAWAYRLNFPDENTAWEWQMEKEKMTEAKFGPHGGILETAPLYTHPILDTLKVAVEASVAQADWIEGFAGTTSAEREAVKIVIAPIREALAALQAEQGAK